MYCDNRLVDHEDSYWTLVTEILSFEGYLMSLFQVFLSYRFRSETSSSFMARFHT